VDGKEVRFTAQDLMAGHRNIATTAAYLYSSPAQLRAAVELA